MVFTLTFFIANTIGTRQVHTISYTGQHAKLGSVFGFVANSDAGKMVVHVFESSRAKALCDAVKKSFSVAQEIKLDPFAVRFIFSFLCCRAQLQAWHTNTHARVRNHAYIHTRAPFLRCVLPFLSQLRKTLHSTRLLSDYVCNPWLCR